MPPPALSASVRPRGRRSDPSASTLRRRNACSDGRRRAPWTMNCAGLPSPPDSVLLTIALLLTFGLAWLLTWGMRRYAVSRQLLDVPNSRSSHAVPTPTGGGVAILVVSLLSIVALGIAGLTPWRAVIAMAGGGAFVGAIGFADDHRALPARWRLAGHFVAAAWFLAWMGGVPAVSAWGRSIDAESIRLAVAALYVAWLLNLTNFMDGIDGLAAIEAMTVCGAGALLCYLATPHASTWVLPLFVASAAGGFFAW